jgi:aminodeoxyfutalosine synthase
MSTSGSSVYDAYSKRLAAGERLAGEDIRELAASHDILALGMLADEARRRAHGTRVTFARVASCAHDKPIAEAVPLTAREVRLTGTPATLDVALTAVEAAKAVAGDRLVSGFSLIDLQALAAGESLRGVLRRLRDAGLEAIAETPIDKIEQPKAALEALVGAGFERIRVTMARPAAGERVNTLLAAVELFQAYPAVQILSPLPMSLAAFRPTTGYEDVRIVALARLAAPEAHVQVDWQRYGPKLAQVALTFGANDLDNVSPSDDAPDGRRRAPLEEVRRNIEAADFSPVERDGRFAVSTPSL